MDAKVLHARETLEAERQAAQARASGLGHRLHVWRFDSITARTCCRACGRPIKIQVVPAGDFLDETVRRTSWLASGVGCKP